MNDQLKSLLLQFERASDFALRFHFATLEKKSTFKGGSGARAAYRTLSEDALRYVPARYLSDEGLLDPGFPPEVLWSLSVIAITRRLGGGKIGHPMVLVRAQKGEVRHDGWLTARGLGLISPFRFEGDVRARVTERWARNGIEVESVEVSNCLECFQDSAAAVSLLLERRSFSSQIDELVPSYENVVRLVWDLDDLISAAEKCGKRIVETETLSGMAVASLSGTTIPIRLGLQWSSQTECEFTPVVNGWSYRAASALLRVYPTWTQFRKEMGIQQSFDFPLDYSKYPKTPEMLVQQLNMIADDLRSEIDYLRADRDLVPSITISVSDALSVQNDSTNLDFVSTVRSEIEIFKNQIENSGAWQLICDKAEKYSQELFHFLRRACELQDIDVARETNAGRGPEDFKFSRGADRAVAEMKLARSTKLEDGLRKQLPQYMASERARHGFYVVIAFTREEVEAANKLEELRIQVADEREVTVELVVIDASSDKPSASTL